MKETITKILMNRFAIMFFWLIVGFLAGQSFGCGSVVG